MVRFTRIDKNYIIIDALIGVLFVPRRFLSHAVVRKCLLYGGVIQTLSIN